MDTAVTSAEKRKYSLTLLRLLVLTVGCVCDYAIRAAVVIWRILKRKWLEA